MWLVSDRRTQPQRATRGSYDADDLLALDLVSE